MPHRLLITLLVAATSSTKKPASTGSVFFLVILVAFAVVYIFVLRPRNRRLRQQSGARTALAVGDDVVTAGGILGTVVDVIGDEVVVEVSPGTTLTFWRRAVNLRSAVAGAPAARAADDAPPDAAGYGVEHRYDDEADEEEPTDYGTLDDGGLDDGGLDDEAFGGGGALDSGALSDGTADDGTVDDAGGPLAGDHSGGPLEGPGGPTGGATALGGDGEDLPGPHPEGR